MKIPPSIIKEYIADKFQDYHVAGEEFIVNSLFFEDSKKHMSVNGETGLWQCFKSKERGSFVHLVSFIEGISYDEASVKVMRRLVDTPELLFYTPQKSKAPDPLNSLDIQNELEHFKLLDYDTSRFSESLIEKLACKMIRSRGLKDQKFYVATGGKYVNRLIIPYEDMGGLYYFQARNILGGGMKYLNPTHKEHGVKSSEVLFPFDCFESYVVVVEGPLDAIALQSLGVNATSIQGSFMSHAQLKELDGFKIILSFDNDAPGKEGMLKSLRLIKSKNLPIPWVVQPPERFKDWNEFTVQAPKKDVVMHINKNVRKMGFDFRVNELLS
jgi:DNA primase